MTSEPERKAELKRGRRPTPPHRVKHGTVQGWYWHATQRKKDPDHEYCQACKDDQSLRQRNVSERRRKRIAMLMRWFYTLTKGTQAKHVTKKDAKEAERLLNRYASKSFREELFSNRKHPKGMEDWYV